MVLKSDDVNYLVYRYLKESGFLHSSYIFQFESQIHKSDREIPNVEPGSLIRVLQKGLQYMDVETHLNEDGTARLCTAPFSLVGKHVCSVQTGGGSSSTVDLYARTNKANGGSGTKQTDAASKSRMDVDEISTSANNAVAAAHGGHTLVHDTATAATTANAVSATASRDRKHAAATGADLAEEDDENMDIDVPDTERDSKKAFSDSAKPGRKARIIDRVLTLRGHTSPVFLCAWNPASNMLATGAGDGTARIWDFSRPKSDDGYVRVLKHEGSKDGSVDITAVVWNAQGSALATASFNGQLRVWTASGEPKFTPGQRQVPIIAMRWNARGNYLLSAYLDGSILLWDVQTGQLRQEFRGHSGSALDIDWQDNTTFASCSADKSIIVWRVGESSPVKTFTGHKSDINAIKWHPNGKYLASSSDDGTVKIWTLSSDTPVQDFIGHAQQVYSLKWLPRSDKAIVASASFDGTVRVWDVHSSSCLRVLSAHTEAVHCFAFSSDGRYLASGSFDKKVRIWSIKDGTLFKTFAADDGVHDVQWAAKGKVAVAIANNTVAVFDPLSA
ncbi:hypothetical protein GGI12_002747 [Dipsacomyces acuminosporus]|nr:hypothetical protein GGI12_002747 [Dipsacomyces acuminosporus]